jgi:hypothetical protein
VKDGEYGINTGTHVFIPYLYTHVCKWKILSVETIPGMGDRGYEGEWSRGYIQL